MTTTLTPEFQTVRDWVDIIASDHEHDPFGSYLMCQFTIAAVLTTRGDHVPDDWDYRHPMCEPTPENLEETDRDVYEAVSTFADQPVVTAALVWYGEACRRLVALARLAGKDY